MGARSASTSFVRDLRRALRYLYDPVALRHSPLLVLFELEQKGDAPVSLRRLLLEAIEALKPNPETPPQANAWRVYQILYERYTEQFSQEEVATHLALGTRQLRRLEGRALRVLADYLWTHYDLERKSVAVNQAAAQAKESRMPANAATPSREQELEWLRTSYPNETISVVEVVQPALKVVAPLLNAMGVSTECTLPGSLPRLLIQPMTLRQALVNVITAAIRAVPQGRIEIGATAHGCEVAVRIQACKGGRQSSAAADDRTNLEMARQMVRFSGGSLTVVQAKDKQYPFTARFTLPAASEVRVLVIDDNVDTLQLQQRYLAGSRYRFTGAADPHQALALAAEMPPDIIVLDVMLPGVDGWELLGRLREHPRTQGVPIIVCTILAQEQLALALGAAAFLHKPVTRDALLAALDEASSLIESSRPKENTVANE